MANDELQALYTTANDLAKHYSLLVNKQRLIVITVGVLAVAACGKLLVQDDKAGLSLAVALWGLIFVIAMVALMRHYRTHAVSCGQAASDIERKLSEAATAPSGAWTRAMHNVAQLEKGAGKCMLYVYGTFIAMAVAFLFIALYSLVQVLKG